MRTHIVTAGSAAMTLTEAKAYLNVATSFTGDDTMITDLIAEAQSYVEQHNDVYLTATTVDVYYEDWYKGSDHYIDINVQPLRAITSIKYTDEDDVVQTLASSNYYIDQTRRMGRIQWIDDIDFPDRADDTYIIVRAECGYSGTEPYVMPTGYKRMMKYLVADFYGNRYNTPSEKMGAAERIMYTYKLPVI